MVNFKKVMLASAGEGSFYFITAFQNQSNQSTWCASTRVLSDGNIAFCGYAPTTAPKAYIGLINPSTGEIDNFVRSYAPAAAYSGNMFLINMDIDSSDNIYASGMVGDENCIFAVKYNSSLAVQWKRKQVHSQFKDFSQYGYPDTPVKRTWALLAGSKFHVGTETNPLFGNQVSFSTSDGAISTDSKNNTQMYYGSDAVYDGSSFHYISGQWNGDYRGTVTKMLGNTAYWTYTYDSLSGYAYDSAIGYGANFYSTADILLAHGDENRGLGLNYIDSNGNLVAARRIAWTGSPSAVEHTPSAVLIDSSGNQYIAGWAQYPSSSSYSTPGFIMKVTSSLTLDWVLHINNDNVPSEAPHGNIYDMRFDANENLVIAGTCADNFGTTRSDGNGFVAVLPNDGSITGSYSNNWDITDVTSSYSFSTQTGARNSGGTWGNFTFNGSNYSGTTGDTTTAFSNETTINIS